MEHTLSYYKIFYTVATTLNISKAAKELFISQPAISKAILKLEQSLGTTLFIRNSRGVLLTYEGTLLYEQLQIAFQAIDLGEAKIKQAAILHMGSLRIGVSSTLCKYVLLPYLKHYMEKYPHVQISIECEGTNEILSLLENGSIDIGLVAKPFSLKHISYNSLDEIQDTFVVSNTYHNRLMRESNYDGTLEHILEYATLMLLDKDNITRQHIDHYLQEQRIQPAHLLEVTSMDLLIDFAKIGIGVSCVIKEFIKDELENGSLLEVPTCGILPKREIGFVYQTSTNKSNALTNFLNMMPND